LGKAFAGIGHPTSEFGAKGRDECTGIPRGQQIMGRRIINELTFPGTASLISCFEFELYCFTKNAFKA
jgi:hypothetical protein